MTPQEPSPKQDPICLATFDQFSRSTPRKVVLGPRVREWRVDSSEQSLTSPQPRPPTNLPVTFWGPSNLPGRVAPSETCVVVHPSVGLLQGVSHAGTLGWEERGARPKMKVG